MTPVARRGPAGCSGRLGLLGWSKMDRTRATGLALVVVSACAFGSGALFAKPVYAAGVTWLTLLAWRFAIGAGLSWIWLLAGPRRSVLFAVRRQSIAVAV